MTPHVTVACAHCAAIDNMSVS